MEPVALDSLDVEAGRRCEVRPEEGRVTARVWEEVRKALAAEAWTREAALYRYTLLRFERTLDRDARELIADSTEIAPDRDAAFYSVPVAELADKGFVQAEGDSSTVYFAPDAGALLSDAFLDTHCLSVRDGGDGRIGLMFQPIPERFVPDIAGVLWLDAATAELDRLEFFYVNLLRSREIGQPGGEVTFARLPSGAWIVSYWRIRMPRLEERSPWRIRRVAYREEGGITQAITDARGRTVLDAASATIFGVVTDSTGTGPPSELVAVEIVGTGQRTTPDDDGAFLFSGLATGRHVLRVQRVLFSRWGLASPELAVEGEFGEVAYARLRVPSVADALAASCGGAPRPEGTAAVLGRIIAEDGRPVGGDGGDRPLARGDRVFARAPRRPAKPNSTDPGRARAPLGQRPRRPLRHRLDHDRRPGSLPALRRARWVAHERRRERTKGQRAGGAQDILCPAGYRCRRRDGHSVNFT